MQVKFDDVVVTGIGVVAPNGVGIDQYYNNCIKGVSGINKCSIMKEFNFMSDYAGEIKDGSNLRWEEKYKKISELAMDEMLRDARLTKEDIADRKERAALSVASANVGSIRLEPQIRKKYSKSTEGVNYLINSDSDILDFNSTDCIQYFVKQLGIGGPVICSNSACASGTIAIGEAYRMIKSGVADYVVSGGVDVLSDLSLSGFNAMVNLSKEPCSPFDKNNKGITIGEGAAFFMLERYGEAKKRGAKIYGRIFGFSTANDAYHVTAPDPNGSGAIYCMKNVFRKRKLSAEDVLYINAHGTGTLTNDRMELKAIEKVVEELNLEKVWFSSTKSMIGHCLGASGSLEFACSAKGLLEGIMPCSISVEEPLEYDSEHMILVQREEDSRNYNLFISNSFAFAGNSACIGMEKIE